MERKRSLATSYILKRFSLLVCDNFRIPPDVRSQLRSQSVPSPPVSLSSLGAIGNPEKNETTRHRRLQTPVVVSAQRASKQKPLPEQTGANKLVEGIAVPNQTTLPN